MEEKTNVEFSRSSFLRHCEKVEKKKLLVKTFEFFLLTLKSQLLPPLDTVSIENLYSASLPRNVIA